MCHTPLRPDAVVAPVPAGDVRFDDAPVRAIDDGLGDMPAARAAAIQVPVASDKDAEAMTPPADRAAPGVGDARGDAPGAPAAAAASAPPGGSRRRRLWELAAHCHCPVLGVCIPMPVLRRCVGKALALRLTMDDYALHVRCVGECKRRTPVTEALQRELDARYAPALRRFAAAKSAEAVLALWQEAVAAGDVAGALWAALSHARCDEPATQRIYADVHMLQHQAGAERRGDLRVLEAEARQGREAQRELAALQERQRRAQAERAAEAERLQAQLQRARAELIGRDSLLAAARSELAELQHSVPDLASRSALLQRVAELTERNRELARQLAEQSWARKLPVTATTSSAADAVTGEERRSGSEASKHREAQDRQVQDRLSQTRALQERARDDSAATVGQGPALESLDLDAKAVLCVGGRHNVVSVYRDLVERHGGRFAHHDGGLEHTARQLDASLAAADLVICQTGCISHNAYWLVKNHCKRTGKACVYLDKPSGSSFAKGLKLMPKAPASSESA